MIPPPGRQPEAAATVSLVDRGDRARDVIGAHIGNLHVFTIGHSLVLEQPAPDGQSILYRRGACIDAVRRHLQYLRKRLRGRDVHDRAILDAPAGDVVEAGESLCEIGLAKFNDGAVAVPFAEIERRLDLVIVGKNEFSRSIDLVQRISWRHLPFNVGISNGYFDVRPRLRAE